MCHVEMELKKLGEPLSFFNFLLGGPIFRSYYAPWRGVGGGGWGGRAGNGIKTLILLILI